MSPDLSKFSLWDLYRGEVETHSKTLNDGLLAIEERPDDLDRIKALMRAAHSIKGAARVVRHGLAVEVAHAMEDRFVAAQSGTRALTGDDLQRLLEGVDLLGRLSPAGEADRDEAAAAATDEARRLVTSLSATAASSPPPAAPPAAAPVSAPPLPVAASAAAAAPAPAPTPASPPDVTAASPAPAIPAAPAPRATGVPQAPPPAAFPPDAADRSLRLTAQTVTRLMGLAGEAVVATRWLEPFARELGTRSGASPNCLRRSTGWKPTWKRRASAKRPTRSTTRKGGSSARAPS